MQKVLCGFINYQVVLKNGFLILKGSTGKAGGQTSCAFLISAPSVSSKGHLLKLENVAHSRRHEHSWSADIIMTTLAGLQGPKQKGLLFLKWEKEARVF